MESSSFGKPAGVDEGEAEGTTRIRVMRVRRDRCFELGEALLFAARFVEQQAHVVTGHEVVRFFFCHLLPEEQFVVVIGKAIGAGDARGDGKTRGRDHHAQAVPVSKDVDAKTFEVREVHCSG